LSTVYCDKHPDAFIGLGRSEINKLTETGTDLDRIDMRIACRNMRMNSRISAPKNPSEIKQLAVELNNFCSNPNNMFNYEL
jgi:hypothetical protein